MRNQLSQLAGVNQHIPMVAMQQCLFIRSQKWWLKLTSSLTISLQTATFYMVVLNKKKFTFLTCIPTCHHEESTTQTEDRIK